MTEFNFIAWENILKCHFHTQRKCRLRPCAMFNLIINLEAVNSGLKPGFLWDVKTVTMEHPQLLNLVTDLKNNKLLHSGIYLVCIGDELIVTNLRRVYDSCSSNSNDCFVNVSPQLDAPCIVQEYTDVAGNIHCMLEDVSKRIAEFLGIETDSNKPNESADESNSVAVKYNLVSGPCSNSSCKRKDKKNVNFTDVSKIGIDDLCLADKDDRGQRLNVECLKELGTSVTETGVSETFVDLAQHLKGENKRHFILKIDQNWCVPTLLGVFLGYPIVYWFKPMSMGNDGETCLSFVPLTVFKINVEICGGYQNQNKCDNLYSFSIPSDALPHLEHKVRQWFKDLMDITKSQTGHFKNIRLTKEFVVLPSVVL